MGAVVLSERDEQRERALGLANSVRFARRDARVACREVSRVESAELVCGWLREPPFWADTLATATLLSWLRCSPRRKIDSRRVLQLLAAARVRELRTVGKLTDRQVRALCAQLQLWAEERPK